LSIQPKLQIGSVADPLEHEADVIADQVMNTPDESTNLHAGDGTLQRKCSQCTEEERNIDKLARTEARGSGAVAAGDAPSIVKQVLRRGGQPLDRQTRELFESRFKHSFASVRVHTDSLAAKSAAAVQAEAYTVGTDVVFAANRYSPRSSEGKRLLSHELAHVVQQRSAVGLPVLRPVSVGLAERVLQRQPTPGTSPQTSGEVEDKGKNNEDDEPTPFLTLQAQGLVQYSRFYTIPEPPPWLIGAQLAANFQFHKGKKGFELALIGQYGRILTLDNVVSSPGAQWQVALQPSLLVVNTGSKQLSLFGQGGYTGTTSKDPTIAGKQYSVIGGLQATQDLFSIGQVKLQVAESVAAGVGWAKGPADQTYSAGGTWQVGVGLQVAWDAVKRDKPKDPESTAKLPPPPTEKTEVKMPDAENQKPKPETPKDTGSESPKPTEDQKKPPDQPVQPPLPPDTMIFFVKDEPRDGLAKGDKGIIASGMSSSDLTSLKSLVQTTLQADSTVKVAIIGFASIEGPNAQYNCELGARRAEWLRNRLAIDATRVADPIDKSVVSGNCQDNGGIVSFGSTKAADTKAEEERKRDRFAVVHFHR